MAEIIKISLLLISLLTLSPHSTLSLPSTTHFDVASSHLLTLHVISQTTPTPTTQDHVTALQETPATATSPLSFTLHPRSSVHATHYDSYKSLTQSRLERDSARVDSINSKLELVLNGVNRSEMTPLEKTVYEKEDFETPLTSGAGQGSGEYFARVGVGSPVKEYYFVTDTGSDVSWLQCSPCTDCYQQSDSVFDPSGSSTYKSLSCDSAQCQQLQSSYCQSGSCLYQVSYGDGSFTTGNFATETLSFGKSGSVDNVAIGCGHDNEGLFVGAAGLLGLGGGSLSFPSQLKATSFSYCLVNRDSSASSTLEFNAARPTDSVTAALLRNTRVKTYLYVDFAGFVVGGRTVELPPSVFSLDDSGHGGIIVDSGTAITRLKTEAYNALRDSFVSQTRDLPKSDSYVIFDTCYDLSGMQQITIPTLYFLFTGGKSLKLPPENYLIPVDGNGKYCFAFAPTNGQLSIIGNVQQQGTRVSYDLENSVVGFSPKNC